MLDARAVTTTLMRFAALALAALLEKAPGWKVASPDSFTIQDGATVAHGTPGHA